MRTLATFAAAMAGCLAVAAPSGAAVVNVNCATQSLQAQIFAANPGDTLRIKGTCVGRFDVSKNLTLAGNPRATLDAGQLGRTVTLGGAPTVVLRDLTITGGHVLNGTMGGGILQTAGSLTLVRVTVAGNVVAGTSTAFGGGLASAGGSLAIRDAVFRGNAVQASSGGATTAAGGALYRNGPLVLLRTTLTGNTAFSHSTTSTTAIGGGAYAQGGSLTLDRSRVTANRAAGHVDGVGQAAAQGGGLAVTGAGPLTLRNAHVSGNQAAAVGSGIVIAVGGGFLSSAPVVVRDSRVERNALRGRAGGAGNLTAYGGGGYVSAASALFVRSRITGSTIAGEAVAGAEVIGGGLALTGATTTLRQTRIASNTVQAVSSGANASGRAGGALSTSPVTLDRVTIDRNRIAVTAPSGTATGAAGGLEAASTFAATASTISRNVVGAATTAIGGGLYLVGGGAVSRALTNSTVAANRVSGTTARGGGILVDGDLTLTSSTVARNTAGLDGAGILALSGTTTIRGTIVAQNTAPTGRDCVGTVASSGFNLLGSTAGCTFTPVASDRRNVAARLAQLRANGGPTQTIALRKGSPARNAIPKAQCPVARDQRGVKRPQQKRCEIGAYERKP